MTIPYSAGMIPRGAFYNAPGLMRYGSGGQQDPLAALIGNALGTYQSATEKQQADARDQQQIDDAKNYRTTQAQLEAYKAGLAPISPPDTSPQTTGSTALDQATGQDPFTAPPAGPKPVMTIGGTPYGRDVGRELGKGQFIEPGPGGGDILYGDPSSGNIRDTGVKRPGDVPKAPGFHIEFSDDGSGTGRQVGKWVQDTPSSTPPQTVPGLVHQGADPNKPTADQRNKAEFGTAALAAWQDVDRIRQQNPQVESEVGKILTTPAFVQAVPGLKSASDAALAIQKAGGSTAAQEYMRAKWPLLDNIVRTRFQGARLSGQYFQQIAGEFMPGLDEQGIPQIRRNELEAIATAEGEAGIDDNPDVWGAAAKRHGVVDFDLQDALSGGRGDARMKRIKASY